jgi:hypothetical protein
LTTVDFSRRRDAEHMALKYKRNAPVESKKQLAILFLLSIQNKIL